MGSHLSAPQLFCAGRHGFFFLLFIRFTCHLQFLWSTYVNINFMVSKKLQFVVLRFTAQFFHTSLQGQPTWGAVCVICCCWLACRSCPICHPAAKKSVGWSLSLKSQTTALAIYDKFFGGLVSSGSQNSRISSQKTGWWSSEGLDVGNCDKKCVHSRRSGVNSILAIGFLKRNIGWVGWEIPDVFDMGCAHQP